MPPRVIAVGDIHGCAAALRALVSVVEPTADDTLIILGDCVDRGPDSRGVLDQLLDIRQRCQLITLMGNHEELMLNALDRKPQPDDWLQCGGAATMKSYGPRLDPRDIPAEHIDFIRSWRDYYETPSHFFVHAAYDPDLPFEKQHTLTLRWHSLRDRVPEPHVSGRTAVVGHTSQKSGEVFNAGHIVCIDTFCWGGGWLTALEPATGNVWQVDRAGKLRLDSAPLGPAKSV